MKWRRVSVVDRKFVAKVPSGKGFKRAIKALTYRLGPPIAFV